ncbi:MAG TPA: 2-oxoglutarate dehydrogenase complex dihydrolipoyllysine-residue succinyltransferase [Luteitalea sp.]|nr:2-oxoglutarate dehydrogenase complex dihydrolipoyllysine-residue succinyltransferase [Luteitalea sp.]
MAAQVVVPQLGESVVEARVARWLKKEGDVVAIGDALVELETEKIDLEVNADQAGVLGKILRQEGEDVKVGEPLASIEAGSGAAAAPAAAASEAAPAATGDSGAPAAATPAPPEAGTPAVSAAPAGAAAEAPRSTPAARKAAEVHQVDMAQVQGSGDAGRVMKRDVEAAAGQPAAAPAAPAPAPAAKAPAPPAPPRPAPAPGSRTEERVRMSKRRLTIARNLVEAQRTAAMLTTFNEVDMTELMALRDRRKDAFTKRHGVGIGIASFFVQAAVSALKAFPRLNAEIQGEEMVLKHYYDIGIAVGAEQGLVVPVIRNAEQLPFLGIEQAIRDFAARAKSNTLTLEDLKGGSFTITNGGVFGSLLSTPIINPPQVGILGLHKIEDRPVAVKGQVVIRPMMYVALSYDHRIVDGLEAVQFLVRVKEFIEDPGLLLLES